MKKYIFLLAFATSLTACQKIQAGGNMGVIEELPGVVSYKDPNAPESTYVEKVEAPKSETVQSAQMAIEKDSVIVAKPQTEVK